MSVPDKPHPPRRFHVMAKPGGSACNLDCAYCFYLGKESLRGGPGQGRMSDETLEAFTRQYIEGVTSGDIVFSWQGGEPTLLGLDFFRKALDLQARFARPGQRIENDLQTNGTLLTEEWAAFLKEKRFLVGLSIDGPRELHDRYRVSKGGDPTFDRVFRAAKLLQHHKVRFNTLTCVHRFNASRPLDVYRFLRRELGSTSLQFIPIVEYRGFEHTSPNGVDRENAPLDGSPAARPGHPDSIATDWSVAPEEWGYFLSRVFDEWRSRDFGKVFVNQIETLVARHMGMPAQLCVYGEVCGKCLAIEHDGSVYSCDHFVYPDYRLGNIHEKPLAEMAMSPEQIAFGYAKGTQLPSYCRQCAFLQDCWGECPKNRVLRTPDGEPGLNYLCRGFLRYFEHAVPEIQRIAAGLRDTSRQGGAFRPRG